MSATDSQMRYYNSGTSLGVIGTHTAHQDGEHTYLPSHADGANGPWIRSSDLHVSRASAEAAPVAKFYRTEAKT